jgi:hypothetical protein
MKRESPTLRKHDDADDEDDDCLNRMRVPFKARSMTSSAQFRVDPLLMI